MMFFSDIFGISEELLEKYGALNISLINDLPLFIDPFLLYASDKAEYKMLHEEIINYLLFLRDKAVDESLSLSKIARWYRFPEIKENWLGYSESGNIGSGLGIEFGKSMSAAMQRVFATLGKETITESSHLEKISLFRAGVGRDNISDFTCNLIKHYLLDYTQNFAKEFLRPEQCKKVSVQKVHFDYKLEVWKPAVYYLPYFNNEHVILTPKDLLTKDETWINLPDLRNRLLDVANSIPNAELRDQINDCYNKCLPKHPKAKDKTVAAQYTINHFPKLIDYYIKMQEENKEGAKAASSEIVSGAKQVYISNVQKVVDYLYKETDFYKCEATGSFESSMRRVQFLKTFIEDMDGYKLLYHNGNPIKKEKDLQLLFKLTWFGTLYDVNAEVNNGRGPVDYKISMGMFDKTLVEFKLASNPKLKKNLQNQVEVYEQANNTHQSIKVILYFNVQESVKLNNVLKELNLQGTPNIILIDACDNKLSASNV